MLGCCVLTHLSMGQNYRCTVIENFYLPDWFREKKDQRRPKWARDLIVIMTWSWNLRIWKSLHSWRWTRRCRRGWPMLPGKKNFNCKFYNIVHKNLQFDIEIFYLNTIKRLFLFVEHLDQLQICLPYSRL